MMQQFYYLDFDPDQVAKQYDDIVGPYNFDAPDSIWKINWNAPLGSIKPPPGAKLKYKSRVTDYLCIMPISFPFLVISEKMMRVISTLNIPEHQFFPFDIYHRDKKHQFYIFLTFHRSLKYINLEKSKFYTYKHQKKIADIEINSLDKYHALLNEIKPPVFIQISSLHLNTDIIKHDIFRISPLVKPNYIVSDKFVSTIQENKLTGIKFKPLEGSNA